MNYQNFTPQYITYHKIIDFMESVQQASPRLQSFGHGDIVYFSQTLTGGTATYPYMFVTPMSISYAENTTQYQLNVIFGDIVNTDLSNEIDVVSDMSLEARNLLSQIWRGSLFNDIADVQLPTSATPFLERFNDHIGGVSLDLIITVMEDMNACPMYDLPVPTETPICETPTPTPSITPTATPPVVFNEILLGGNFTLFNDLTRQRMLALEESGVEVTSFYSNLGAAFANGTVENIVIQPDEKILVCGNFVQFNNNIRRRLIRLNSDGTEDTAFYTNLGTAFDGLIDTVNVTTLQPDGKILVGGTFLTFNGQTRNRFLRLNSDGTEDTAFYTNLGTAFGGGGVNTIILQADGKILLGGSYTTFNGNTRNRLLRLNSDGTEDTAFYTNLGTGFNSAINNIILQPDGKIVVGGAFTTFNGNTRNRLIRLNSDGTEDTAFYNNLGTSFGSGVNTITLQPDGKILGGGLFTTFNGQSRNRLVRLNSDGTEDTAFYTNLGTGFNTISVATITLQPDGKILVGGSYTTFNNLTRNRIVRLNSDGTEDTAFYNSLGTAFDSTGFSTSVDVIAFKQNVPLPSNTPTNTSTPTPTPTPS